MTGFPEKDLEETRAALAPTLEATAAILPWVAKPQPSRFSEDLNQRWIEGRNALSLAWDARHQEGTEGLRPAIYQLLAVTLETGDIDYLALGEALASLADHLDTNPLTAKITAAFSATLEALQELGSLENPALPARARHFADRINQTLLPSNKPGERSDVLDDIFVEDSYERLEVMRDALEVLPIDIYALKLESESLTRHAEQIDMWGIVHLARQLEAYVLSMDESNENTQDKARFDITSILDTLEEALGQINH